MPTRRLDDRIRQLCADLAKTPAGSGPLSAEEDATLQELLAAIHEKMERLRRLAARKLLNASSKEKEGEKERRTLL